LLAFAVALFSFLVKMRQGKQRQVETSREPKTTRNKSKQHLQVSLVAPALDSDNSLTSDDDNDHVEFDEDSSKIVNRNDRRGGRELKCHRIRFVDYAPSAITSLALAPTAFDVTALYPFAEPSRGLLAVGRANGQIEIYAWIGGARADNLTARKVTRSKLLNKSGNKQTWVMQEVLPASKEGLPIERLVWVHRSTLTEDELELFDEDEERNRELSKLKKTMPRIFSTNGTNDISEWQFCYTPNLNTRVGDIKRISH